MARFMSKNYSGASNEPYERLHDACRLCGIDADAEFIDQFTGLCNACMNEGD